MNRIDELHERMESGPQPESKLAVILGCTAAAILAVALLIVIL